jgi:nucleoside-diphosphate-sugar epimerase
VRHLARKGVPVRAVVRDPSLERCTLPPNVEVFHGDAVYRHSAMDAARGATVVYRCIPVRYSLWAEVWLTATQNIIAAAEKAGAVLVSPGNVYVYGPTGGTPVDEDHALQASGEKGRLRVVTQGTLCRAHRDGKVQVVIPRFPDLYGPCVINRVFGALFERVAAGHPVTWFGDPDVERDVLFVEDAAAAAVLLGASPKAYGHVWHVPGPGAMTPRAFVEQVCEVAGRRSRVHRMSEATVRLKCLIDPETREFLEFRYLYEEPNVLDGRRFAAAFPDFRYTPREEAIRRTLDWFGGVTAARLMTGSVQ